MLSRIFFGIFNWNILITRGASLFQHTIKSPDGLYCKWRNRQEVSPNEPLNTAKSHQLQWSVHQLSQICHHFYQNYCPDSFKYQRNVGLAKVSDESILVLLLLQAELGMTSQRHFYTICHLFPCGQLLERSCFNRRSKQLIWLIQLIRKAMSDMISPDGIAIIDSFPLPLCQPVRNHRATIFKGLADIGYNASKHLWFYGFKVHMLVTLSGYILNYVITPASVHDIKGSLWTIRRM